MVPRQNRVKAFPIARTCSAIVSRRNILRGDRLVSPNPRMLSIDIIICPRFSHPNLTFNYARECTDKVTAGTCHTGEPGVPENSGGGYDLDGRSDTHGLSTISMLC